MRHTFRSLSLVSCLFVAVYPLHTQWIQTNGPGGRQVNCFAIIPDGVGGTNLLAGTSDSGVFLSTNNGTIWTAVDNGLTNLSVFVLVASGTNLFAGTDGGVFLSTDVGTTWAAVNSGLTNAHIRALAISPASGGTGTTSLFAGTNGGVFLSTNNGTNWIEASAGLTSTTVAALAFFPNATGGTNLFAGTNGGVFLSTNNGAGWSPIGLTRSDVRSLAVSANGTGGTKLFAGTTGGSGMYLSTDNGTSWTAINTGLISLNIYALALSPNGTGGMNLFAGTDGAGIFLLTNNGTSWFAVNTSLTSSSVWCLVASSTNLFAGTSGGVWRRPLSQMITSVENTASGSPTHFALEQNYPNPFNPSTTISFSLRFQSWASLKVFDALGREVSTLLADDLPAGTYACRWNAAALPSGVYFYRLQAGSFTETKKLVLLR